MMITSKRPTMHTETLVAGAAALLLGVLVVMSVPNGSVRAASSAPTPPPEDHALATFGGGCFWCTEAVFESTAGVYSAVSGYSGGLDPEP